MRIKVKKQANLHVSCEAVGILTAVVEADDSHVHTGKPAHFAVDKPMDSLQIELQSSEKVLCGRD